MNLQNYSVRYDIMIIKKADAINKVMD